MKKNIYFYYFFIMNIKKIIASLTLWSLLFTNFSFSTIVKADYVDWSTNLKSSFQWSFTGSSNFTNPIVWTWTQQSPYNNYIWRWIAPSFLLNFSTGWNIIQNSTSLLSLNEWSKASTDNSWDIYIFWGYDWQNFSNKIWKININNEISELPIVLPYSVKKESVIYNSNSDSFYIIWWETDVSQGIRSTMLYSKLWSWTISTSPYLNIPSNKKDFWAVFLSWSQSIIFWWTDDNGSVTWSLFLKDFSSNTYRTLSSLPIPVAEFSYAYVDNKIYVAWWTTDSNTPSRTINKLQIYDVWSDQWSSTWANLPENIKSATMQEINWNLYLIWWENETWAPLKSIYVYNTKNNNWSKSISELSVAKTNLFSAKRNNMIYIMWWNTWNDLSNSIEIYNPSLDHHLKSSISIQNIDSNLTYTSPLISSTWSTWSINFNSQIIWNYSWYFETPVTQNIYKPLLKAMNINLLSSIPDWKYNISINTEGDWIFYDFIKDTTLPVVTSTWSIDWLWTTNVNINNINITEKNLKSVILQYTLSSNSDYSNAFTGVVNWNYWQNNWSFTWNISLTNLSPWSQYKYKILAIDAVGNNNIPWAEWSFTTLSDTIQNRNSIRNPNNVYRNPLQIYFSNDQISSWINSQTWTLRFVIKNDRNRDLTGIWAFGFALDKRFVLPDFWNMTWFSWALNGVTCQTQSLDNSISSFNYNWGMNFWKCQLSQTWSLTFASWSTSEFHIDWIWTPSDVWIYNVNVWFIYNQNQQNLWTNWTTQLTPEIFSNNIIIKDHNDFSAPILLQTIVDWPNSLFLMFDKPVFSTWSNNNATAAGWNVWGTTATITGTTNTWSRILNVQWNYIDWQNNSKVHIYTDSQNPIHYDWSISGISNFNWRSSGSIAFSFTWFDVNAPYIDYMSPYTLQQGTKNVTLDIYWKNNIFSGSTLPTIWFWDNITYSWINKIDSNHIQLLVNIWTGAVIWNRDLIVWSKTKYNWFYVDKNWNTLVDLIANIIPWNNYSWQSSSYNINFPTSKQLSTGDQMTIQFPQSFDLANATLDLWNQLNFINNDITQQTKYIFSKDLTTNSLIFTLKDSYQLQEKDNVSIAMIWIVNPTDLTTSNNFIANVSTANAWGTVLDSFKSNPIYLKDSSLLNQTLTIQLQDTNWNPINSSNIVLNINWPNGYTEGLTNSSWSFTLTWQVNSYYNINLDPILKQKSDYIYNPTNYSPVNKNINVFLDTTKFIIIQVKNMTGDDFATLSWNINWLNWKNVTLWLSSRNIYLEKDLWTLNSDNFSYSIKIPKNSWLVNIWIRPTIAQTFWNAGTTAATNVVTSYTNWQPPKASSINIMNIDIPNVNFTVIPPSITLTITTQTNSNVPVANANVYVYSPSGDSMWLNWTTDMNWSVSFKVLPWIYSFGAYKNWLPNVEQKTVSIISQDVSQTIIFQIPDQFISGQVLLWTDPLANVSIYAYETTKWQYLNTTTDTSWNYKLYTSSWSWKVWWWVSSLWALTEKVISVTDSAVSWQNFVINNSDLYKVSGTVTLWSWSWTWISETNLYATPLDWDYSKGWYSFTDNNWNYVLTLKPWSYNIKAFNSKYWDIWNINVTVSSSDIANKNIIVPLPQSVTLSFTGNWVPSDLSKFDWLIDIYDKIHNRWFSQNIKGSSSYTFDNVPNWLYSVKVNVLWLWSVYDSWSVNVSDTTNILMPINSPLVSVNGILYESWTTNIVKDAYIELLDKNKNQTYGVKTDWSWSYDIAVSSWTLFEITAKKPWYNMSNTLTGITNWSWFALNWQLTVNPISSTISIIGSVIPSDSSFDISNNKIYVNVQWVDNLWNDTKKWYWQELTLSWNTFQLDNVPSNFGSWKIIVSVDGFTPSNDSIRLFGTTDVNVWSLSLQKIILNQPTSSQITPSQGWVIEDSVSQFKIVIPSSSLGDWTNPWTVIAKETSKTPSTPWYWIVWNAKEINAFDSDWNPITTLNSEITLEFTNLWSELFSSNSWITLQDIQNMQIYYFDATSSSWISLPTIVSSSSWTLFTDNSWSTLLSSISWYWNITFTLKAKTNHLTMFTSLVSSIITSADSWNWNNDNQNQQQSPPQTTNNWWGGWGGEYGGGIASTSLISWITNTANSLNSYFGNIEQSIVLQSWDTLNSVLAITRDGKQISVWDILAAAQNSVSNISKNAVSFAVWDIISSGNWTAEISLWWYTTVDLTRNSAVKIDSAWDWFLTFENVKWTWHYHFDKRDEWNFKYEIKWKVWYATIRGTTLEVSSDLIKDKYYLIEWKIDVYNSILDKTITMHSWDVYIAYANWDESFTASEQPKQSVTDVINKVIPIDKPIEQGISSSQDLSSQTQNTFNSDGIDSTPKTFMDVLPNNWFFAYITNLSNKWIVKGYSDWKFHPERNITRAELMSMISKSVPLNYTFDSDFSYSDINPNDWWAPLVSTAKKLWYISQTQQKFRPKDRITRAEALKIILNFKQVDVSYDSSFIYNDVNKEDWFAPYVSYSKQHWYISMTNILFRPNDPITRWEMSKMLYNILLK